MRPAFPNVELGDGSRDTAVPFRAVIRGLEKSPRLSEDVHYGTCKRA